MEEKHRLWVGSAVSTYAQVISTSAPDAIVTLGVLLYILAHRAYTGVRQGWTQVPIQYMATRGQMRFGRIRDALSWMEEQGMVVTSRTNEDSAKQFRAGWYKLSSVVKEQADFSAIEERKKKQQELLKATPSSVAGGPSVTVVMWSPLSETVEWEIVSSEYANSLSKCVQCGHWFDPTLGKHPNNDITCVACYIRETVVPGEPAHLTLEFEEYDWTVDQVDRFIAGLSQHKSGTP